MPVRRVLGLCRGPCVWEGLAGGKGAEVVLTVLARGRWSIPEALLAGTRGPRALFAVILSVGAHVHPTLLVHHLLGLCPGPFVKGFALDTHPLGKNRGVPMVWCGVV